MTEDEDDFSDLDLLMSKLDEPGYIENMPKVDLMRQINYQRKKRKEREAGVRTRKPKAAPAVSIEQLLSTMVQPAPQTTAPGKGFRRF
jgi:hypothetical protein